MSEGAGARTFNEDMDQDEPALEKSCSARSCPRPRPPRSPCSSNQPPPANLKDLAAKIEQPVLLIAAPQGRRRGAQSRLRDGGGRLGTLWEIPESTHAGGQEARPEEYERRVVGFFDRRWRR